MIHQEEVVWLGKRPFQEHLLLRFILPPLEILGDTELGTARVQFGLSFSLSLSLRQCS